VSVKVHDRANEIEFVEPYLGGSWCQCNRQGRLVGIKGYDAALLTPRQARDVARWLNETADQIERDIKAGKAYPVGRHSTQEIVT